MYTVRDLQETDMLACHGISASLWGSRIAGTTYRELLESLEFSDSTWPPCFIVATHNDHEVIGFAGYRRCLFMADAWESCWVNVHKDHQRAGVGKLLVEERNDRIKQLGGVYVISSVLNPAFSLSNGNKQIDKIGDTYIMVKHL